MAGPLHGRLDLAEGALSLGSLENLNRCAGSLKRFLSSPARRMAWCGANKYRMLTALDKTKCLWNNCQRHHELIGKPLRGREGGPCILCPIVSSPNCSHNGFSIMQLVICAVQ